MDEEVRQAGDDSRAGPTGDPLITLLHGDRLSTEDGRMTFQAIPGRDSRVPIWLHSSGTYRAQLAGAFGLPFAFAGHLSPADMTHALRVYRQSFQPSIHLDEPYTVVAVSAVAADTSGLSRKPNRSPVPASAPYGPLAPGRVEYS